MSGVTSVAWRAVRTYLRRFGNKTTVVSDLKAGLVLGVESVPDGLAAGLLAGVNPVFGLYGYLIGTIGGALAAGSVLMTVQATGAMAVIISDVPQTQGGDGASSALATLAFLTGLTMFGLGGGRRGTVGPVHSNGCAGWLHQRRCGEYRARTT